MGSSESSLNSNKNKVIEFNKKYNWILSYPQREREILSENNVTKVIGTLNTENKSYVDLRVNCPPILDIGSIPLHPIASVCSLLNYQLNKNKLPTFPPSRLFIYKNISFFPNVKSVISYEMIFNSLLTHGFCSEIDCSFYLECWYREKLDSATRCQHFRFCASQKPITLTFVNVPTLDALWRPIRSKSEWRDSQLLSLQKACHPHWLRQSLLSICCLRLCARLLTGRSHSSCFR